MENAADIISVFHFRQSNNNEKWGQVFGQVSLFDAHRAILRPANTEQANIFKIKVKVKFTLFPARKVQRPSIS